MRLTFIGCPFRTSYGHYIDSLRRAMSARSGDSIEWVASNCGCGDPVERDRLFQIQPTSYFEMSHVPDWESRIAWRRWLRRQARSFTYYRRARRYRELARGREVLHFQQTLNAFGAVVAFHWLRLPAAAAKVVTVHEIDAYQDRYPQANLAYNRADAIIVHNHELKDRLARFGVQASRIHFVPYGADVPSQLPDGPRDGILFYGGHHLMSRKGLDVLFRATAILRDRLADEAPRVKVHGHYGAAAPEAALQLAEAHGVSDRVRWLNQVDDAGMGALYRSALICVLPYSGSFAGLPAGAAAANGAPVIATRRAGVPEHLGECAVWIEDGDAAQLAREIETLLANAPLRADLARRAYERAKAHLSWEVAADQTLEIYRDALRSRGH
jgi:glycosyltransferase involved in cell wall biosynthesis